MPRLVGFFFFQAEDGIRDRSPSRGLGDVYKRQCLVFPHTLGDHMKAVVRLIAHRSDDISRSDIQSKNDICLLYTSDAADEEDSVDLGGRRIIKKKKPPQPPTPPPPHQHVYESMSLL